MRIEAGEYVQLVRQYLVKSSESMKGSTKNREGKLIEYCLGRTITCYDRNDVKYVSDVTFSINEGVSSNLSFSFKKLKVVKVYILLRSYNQHCGHADDRCNRNR